MMSIVSFVIRVSLLVSGIVDAIQALRPPYDWQRYSIGLLQIGLWALLAGLWTLLTEMERHDRTAD